MIRLARSRALTIAVKDATEIWRDGRFRGAATLLALLLLVAVAGGAHHQSLIAQQHADAQIAERDVWLDKGEMNPHAAAHYGSFVFKPVQPLSAIDPGLDPFVGVFVFLEAHKQQLARFRPIEDATPTRRLGLLTPAYATLILLPLLIVSLTFSSLAGERERGTLRPLLAAGSSRMAVLGGKALGAVVPLLMVMLPVLALSVVLLWWFTPNDPLQSTFSRASGLIAVYTVHAIVWIALGLTVSARARSQGVALVILLALWFANAFVLPPAAMAAAKRIEPSPSAAEFAAAIAAEKERFPSWDERVEGVTERFLQGDLDRASMPANIEIVALLEAEAEETALYSRHFSALFDTYERQTAIFESAAFIAPSLAARILSMALAATDDAHDRHFARATSGYREAFLSTLNAELAQSGRTDAFDYERGRDLWEKVPEFDYDMPGGLWAVSQHWWSAMALAGWGVGATAAALAAVRTMRLE